jgi:hypothetical protein
MRGIAALVLALVLFVAQAAIVAVGLFAPNVSPQYRAVFIDKTEVDWVREPSRLKSGGR